MTDLPAWSGATRRMRRWYAARLGVVGAAWSSVGRPERARNRGRLV